jgi:hypothetical protein
MSTRLYRFLLERGTQIFVKSLSRNIVTLEVESLKPINNAKDNIHVKEGISLDK